MMNDNYPVGTVRRVLDTNLITAPTAAALRRRLQPANPASLLDPHGLALLAAISERLIPQDDRVDPIDIAARLHRDVAAGGGDGWRYAALPADGTALAAGIRGTDESARAMGGKDFVHLDAAARDAVLAAVQRGEAPGATWGALDPKRWFEELLVALVEVYYGHPLAQEEIGYLGMADAQGWPDVGIGARAPFEPVAQ